MALRIFYESIQYCFRVPSERNIKCFMPTQRQWKSHDSCLLENAEVWGVFTVGRTHFAVSHISQLLLT